MDSALLPTVNPVMLRVPLWIAFTLLAVLCGKAPAAETLPAEIADAIAWYDSLGHPDVKEMPCARVATGLWMQTNGKTTNRFVEGFVTRDAGSDFTIFICSVPELKRWSFHDEPFRALTLQRLVRKADGPEHLRVTVEVLDVERIAADALARARRKAADGEGGLTWGAPMPHRARLFSFARACLQKGLAGTGTELMKLAADIPDEKREQLGHRPLKAILQDQLGEIELEAAELRVADPAVSWEVLLGFYEQFPARFPANQRVGYAREAADLLRQMVAEEKAHRPKPLDQLSAAEQAAENIYQLRHLGGVMWVMRQRYPVISTTQKDGEAITPIHRLVDLDRAAIPALIAALDDRRFTRCLEQSFHTQFPPTVLRVGDVAKRILEHMSGGNLTRRPAGDAPRARLTIREQAEAWWAEMQSKGEREQLVGVVSAGGLQSPEAARRLVEKYPEAALAAIEAGCRAAVHDGTRAALIDVAAKIPGDAPLAFLQSKLTPENGGYSRARAAEALFARNQSAAVPAMIDAWRQIQPRLHGNQDDAYGEAGHIIAFLVKCGNPAAIRALGENLRAAPVDARLAIARAFLPWPKGSSASSNGASVHVDVEIAQFPAAQAPEIERLLKSQLTDAAPRPDMKGHFNEIHFENPRVCDMAALALSQRWPAKYRFAWSAIPAERDAQIEKMR